MSPLGHLTLFEENDAIVALEWGKAPDQVPSRHLNRAKTQLQKFFDGKLKIFDLPLSPTGTDFQKAVWREMQAIPYGETRSYGDVAKTLNSAARAVGGACGHNPIPIIIPCHRIVGSGGKLGGFSGGEGVETKQSLLHLESVFKT